MTTIEEITLTGYFEIEDNNYDTPFPSNIPIPIKFKGSEEGFLKLEKYGFEVDKNLNLKENLEKLKRNNIIVDYKATPIIKEDDIFSLLKRRTNEYYLLMDSQENMITVNKKIFELLDKKNKIIR